MSISSAISSTNLGVYRPLSVTSFVKSTSMADDFRNFSTCREREKRVKCVTLPTNIFMCLARKRGLENKRKMMNGMYEIFHVPFVKRTSTIDPILVHLIWVLGKTRTVLETIVLVARSASSLSWRSRLKCMRARTTKTVVI